MKISFLGNYTLDIISKEFEKKIEDKSIFCSGYNEYYQDFFNKNSGYNLFKSDYSFLFLDGNILLENFKTLSNIKKHLNEIIELFIENNDGYLIISNVYISSSINKIQHYNKKSNIKEIEMKINLHLQKISSSNRLFIFDLCTIIQENGWKNLHNNIMWNYGKVRFNKLGNEIIVEKLLTTIDAINNKTKKCLVLDLDNTLWGGIIGEDGINNIDLGPDGLGESFLEFQKKIKSMKKKGVLLAICSKNNLNDAKKVFTNHNFSYLKWDDFIIKKINWESKNNNIQEIAKSLNIGENSLVFIDDNPTERELVMQYTDAIVPKFPNSPTDLPEFIDEVDLKYFSKYSVTKEDLKKSKQYIDNIRRNKAQKKSFDFDSFIKELNLEMEVSYNNLNDKIRLSQLTQKTNQFNFTTKRYSELDIENFIKKKDSHVFVGSVKDKFGDYGKVIACIIIEKPNEYVIDTFLMSCRVISKQIENYFFNFILSKLSSNIPLYGKHIPTKKNILVNNKYLELGFKLLKKNSDGTSLFEFVEPKALKDNILVKYER
jgi:FkbH-like protein